MCIRDSPDAPQAPRVLTRTPPRARVPQPLRIPPLPAVWARVARRAAIGRLRAQAVAAGRRSLAAATTRR
eukprot:5605408-Prymnesium_polylepis.1